MSLNNLLVFATKNPLFYWHTRVWFFFLELRHKELLNDKLMVGQLFIYTASFMVLSFLSVHSTWKGFYLKQKCNYGIDWRSRSVYWFVSRIYSTNHAIIYDCQDKQHNETNELVTVVCSVIKYEILSNNDQCFIHVIVNESSYHIYSSMNGIFVIHIYIF